MVAAVFPYLSLRQKPYYLSNTEWHLDSIAMSSGRIYLNAGFFSNSEDWTKDFPLRPDRYNLE